MERGVQTIIISGFAEFSYAQKAVSDGIIGYCLKPLEYDEIRRYLRRAVQRLNQSEQQPDYDGLLEGLQDGKEEELLAAFSSFGLNAAAYYAAFSVGREPYPVQIRQDVVLRLPCHLELAAPRNGRRGIQLLLETDVREASLSLTGEGFEPEWFRMIAVPVEYNMGDGVEQGGAMVLERRPEKNRTTPPAWRLFGYTTACSRSRMGSFRRSMEK